MSDLTKPFRIIAFCPLGTARFETCHLNADVAETLAMARAKLIVERYPETGPFSKWLFGGQRVHHSDQRQ